MTVLIVGAFTLCAPAFAQENAQAVVSMPRPLITEAVNEARLTVLKGNTHPMARPEFDLGTAPASLPMERMLLVLKRSDDQEIALRKLLDDQQDKNSPNYHKWLTPEEFGAQFGPTDSDLQTITSWLQSHEFQVGSTKGRTVLEFSGSASQMQEAFHTTIHKYLVNGEQRWANASDPSIPSALAPAVAGVRSLNSFLPKPMSKVFGVFSRDKDTGQIYPVDPVYTLPAGCVENPSSSNPCFYGVSPYDFATIYNVLPLWNSGIDGTGQTIAIVGETNINIQDVRDFRNLFGLPVNDPQIILNGPDPGIIGDEVESNLDLQWSGAVAPNATIKFVTSASTATSAGIDLSALYIIENNVAPVMSESYGYCELGLGTAGNQFYNALWQQAAAQGISVFISSGDNGSAGCDDFNAQSPAPALFGLQVSGFASTPYNIAVGGTDFNDFLNPSTYWKTTNDTHQASAKSYIPEIPWNSSCTNPIFGQIGYSTNAETVCNDPNVYYSFDVPLGGSGGVSKCTTSNGSTTSSCSGGYAKPSWQTGTGVPSDGKRDIPDVSLFASSGFLGNFYIMCQADITGPCALAPTYQFLGIGGTSASSPAFAGIMALVNQKMSQTTPNARQGNANYIFYKLATQQPTVFHDITTGTIAMPCATGYPNCTTSVPGHQFGVLTGYNATSKYDLATGLGTVDANLLVTNWDKVTLRASTTTLSNVTPTTVTHGQAVSFKVTVAPSSGSGTPTGLVSLQGSPTNSSADIQGFTLANGTVSGSTEMLPGGNYSITAHYPGDSTYAASDSTAISVAVNKENSEPQVSLMTFDSTGRVLNGNTNTATYGSPYILRVDVANAGGHICAPLATTGATACPSGTVSLTNNGSTLDVGTYTLTNFGSAEDLVVQLPGGTNSVKADYAGDDSFNASSATTPITITPATTTTQTPNVYGTVVAQPGSMWVSVNTTSSGSAPTGTVTFYANGKALTGTTNYNSGGGGPGVNAILNATLFYGANSFPTPGSYAVTASYGGDKNYAASTSAATNISVKYAIPFVLMTPNSQTVSYGSTATVTALVASTNKNTYPTGTITFFDGARIVSGPTPCTSTTDSGGNYACQASGSFTVTDGNGVTASYSGDSNYPSSNGFAFITMPDFYISPNPSYVSLTAGQSQDVTLYIGSTAGFSGTITNFSCSALPPETTCTITPTQVAADPNQQVATTLTITTTPVGQSRRARRAAKIGTVWITLAGLFLAGACVIGFSTPGKRRLFVGLMALAIMLTLPSCGGGSNGGGGGGNSNPIPHITSLTPSQVAAGSQLNAITVTGTSFMSTSKLSVGGMLTGVYVSPTQMYAYPSAVQLSTVAQLPVVVTNPAPGGGASNAVDFVVTTGTPTGTFYITVRATSGGLTHSTQMSLYIQ